MGSCSISSCAAEIDGQHRDKQKHSQDKSLPHLDDGCGRLAASSPIHSPSRGMAVIIAFPARHPCRKCRTPVKTIATPSRFAAAITSASLTDPPG